MSNPAFQKPILLVGRENMNRAVHGDIVAVEVFDPKDWKAPADEVVDQEGNSWCYLCQFNIFIFLKLRSKMMTPKTRTKKGKLDNLLQKNRSFSRKRVVERLLSANQLVV